MMTALENMATKITAAPTITKPREEVTPLKPSEVLRLSEISGVRQVRWQIQDKNGGFCAFGVLANYYSKEYGFDINKILDRVGGVRIANLIITLNDDHFSSFGDIAKYLEDEGL